MRISSFLEDFAIQKQGVPRPQRAVCTTAGLHSRRVEDNAPYLLGSRYADLGTDAPYPYGVQGRNGRICSGNSSLDVGRWSLTLL